VADRQPGGRVAVLYIDTSKRGLEVVRFASKDYG